MISEKTVSFLTNFIDLKSQIRDDYEQLIELTMIILGDPPKTIHWRAPGPVHHARWIAKLIYAIKIYLFRHQKEIFSLTAKEESQLKRFVQFGALLYTKSWIQAPCAAEAPGGDLLLWKNLQQYQSIDHDISIAAQKILQNHMWYLSDETVSLALFSDEVSPIEKQKIITGFGIEPSERHVRGDPSLLQIEDVSLGHFSTRRSQNLLTKLQIGHSFLVLPPERWNDNTDYQKGKQRINDLRVVKDTAERGVKLFEDYNRLTINEKEKQFILQVVEANRKVIPAQTTKKSVICAVSV
ncbi:hypothetical protein Bpfe_002310 [Biomphalaria pfeifferi]|uniref:Uncharacterized protein n=1 Tax=Biomphalaria pfeifferi TaxID=112525 RepID=A0AAD8FL66_BIOPF|nr:hypothetical protein Bpfe_002310 [Biomphalaria pfeifferi]